MANEEAGIEPSIRTCKISTWPLTRDPNRNPISSALPQGTGASQANVMEMEGVGTFAFGGSLFTCNEILPRCWFCSCFVNDTSMGCPPVQIQIVATRSTALNTAHTALALSC